MQRREAWVVAPIIAILLVLGLFPKPVLDVISPAVDRTMHQVGVDRPEAHAGRAGRGRDEQVIASVARAPSASSAPPARRCRRRRSTTAWPCRC